MYTTTYTPMLDKIGVDEARFMIRALRVLNHLPHLTPLERVNLAASVASIKEKEVTK